MRAVVPRNSDSISHSELKTMRKERATPMA